MEDNKTPPDQDYLQEIIQKVIQGEQEKTRSKITLPVKIAFVILMLVLFGVLALVFSHLTDSQTENQHLLQRPNQPPNFSKEGDLILKKQEINIDEIEATAEEREENVEVTNTEVCAKAALLFKDQKLVKAQYSPSTLFRNVHKKINNTVYRLRFFYKDGDNGNVPTYLVYQEDKSDNEYIIESTPIKKGNIYKRIEKAQGEIIYDSEAYELKDKNDLFIRYENGEVKELQGLLDIEAHERFPLDCIY